MSDDTESQPVVTKPAPGLSPLRESGGAHMPALYDALSMAQMEYPAIEKNHVGEVKGTSRGSGKEYAYTYRYADLADVLNGVRPVINRHGLSLLQIPRMTNGWIILVTRLAHRSGAWIEGDYPVQALGDGIGHQTLGGNLTYAKRQSACAILGVAAEEDLDGATSGGAESIGYAAGSPTSPKAAPPRRQQEAPKQAASEGTAGVETKAEERARAPAPPRADQKTSASRVVESDALYDDMMRQPTAVALTKWHVANADAIKARAESSEAWTDEFYARYDARQAELKGVR